MSPEKPQSRGRKLEDMTADEAYEFIGGEPAHAADLPPLTSNQEAPLVKLKSYKGSYVVDVVSPLITNVEEEN